MSFFDYIRMDAEERRGQAAEVLGESYEDREGVLSVVEEIYEGEAPAGFSGDETHLFLCAALYYDDPAVRERALLTLFHRIEETLADEEELEEARGFLREYSRDARVEQDERLRGRKHWVLLNLLLHEAEANDEVEEYVRSMREEEGSPYVWERMCAVLQGWSESYRLYPELESWNIPLRREGEPYWALVRRTERRHRKSLEADTAIRDGLASFIGDAMSGRFPAERLSWVFENYGRSGSDFPLTADIFSGLYREGGPAGRIVLLGYLSDYLAEGNWSRSRPYRQIVSATPPSSEAVYERSVALLLEGYSFLRGERPESPFSEILELLISPLPHRYERPEVYHSLTGAFTPLLLRCIVDRSVTQEEIRQTVDLLCHSSPYVRASGATLVLQSVRSGYDISPLIPLLKEVLGDDPDSSNDLAAGKDLEDDEFRISFDFPAPKSFLFAEREGGRAGNAAEPGDDAAGGDGGVERSAAGGDEAGKEDGFFNLGNLTGLLEACKPPLIAYRLGRALREHAEHSADTELAAFLSRFADRNSAIEGISVVSNTGEPAGRNEGASETAGGATDGAKSGAEGNANAEGGARSRETSREEPLLELSEGDSREEAGTGHESGAAAIPVTQVGPLTLPEVLNMLEDAVDGVDNPGEAKEKAAQIAAGTAESLEQRYSSDIRELQRRLIAGVFESGEGLSTEDDEARPDGSTDGKPAEKDGAESSAGLFASIYERSRSMGGRPLPLCRESAPQWHEGTEVHPDLLACYVPLYDSPESGEHRYGIYFFINRFLELIFARGLRPEPLLRAVAVHELFHAHMNWRQPEGGKAHRHDREHPGYCRLEEAAANRVACDWLHGQGYEAAVTDAVDAAIFRTYGGEGGGGVPGYGEYPLLDGDAPQLLPEMISNSPQHVEVRHYRTRKALYQWGFSPKRRDSAEWWRWLLETMDEGSVPMYFDVECR